MTDCTCSPVSGPESDCPEHGIDAPAVVSSGPDWDEAVEAALGAWRGRYGAGTREMMRAALAAAYPALTRQAVAAERERIATAIEAIPPKHGPDYCRDAFAAAARIARAEPETTP